MPRLHAESAKSLLKRFDSLPLECDGFSRVATYALTKLGVPHRVMGGYVETPAGVVQPHFWLVLDGGDGEAWVVDYRLRMWAGPNMPHGVFRPPAGIFYHGEEVSLQCDPFIFDVLTSGVGAVLLKSTEAV